MTTALSSLVYLSNRELVMADLLVLFWVSFSMGIVVLDAWGGFKPTLRALPPASEVAIA